MSMGQINYFLQTISILGEMDLGGLGMYNIRVRLIRINI